MEKYDVIILGGGTAGYHAALALSKENKSVLVIEQDKIGGTCLHHGCIPTKSLLKSAKEFERYYRTYESVFDEEKAHEIKGRTIERLYVGLKKQIEQCGIKVVKEYGRIIGKEKEVFEVEAGDKRYSAINIIVATGSKNRMLPIEGIQESLDKKLAMYSEQFLDTNCDEEDVIIIGGGVIGIEFATYLGETGRNVTVLEYENEVMKDLIDEDIRTILVRSLQNRNINFITSAHVQEIDGSCIVYERNGVLEEMQAGRILLAGGREGSLAGIGLDRIGLDCSGGFLQTDDLGQTTCEGVYACGDVTGKYMLAHVAAREAEAVVENICGGSAKVNYAAVPQVVFSNPETALAGLSEQACQAGGMGYYVRKCSMHYSGKYMIDEERQQGLCKLIFNTKDVLIGAQLIGNGSSELIFVLADMIDQEVSVEKIRKKIYPHPSLTEIIKEAVNLG